MRITLAQLNYHVGNIKYNSAKIIEQIRKAKIEESDLVVFSELAICGYPPKDLLEIDEFIDSCIDAVNEISKECNDIAAIIGAPSVNKQQGKVLLNSAYFLADGKIISVHDKGLLPNYDVFDEYRFFESGKNINCINYKGKKIALTICEDLWDDYAQKSYKGVSKSMYQFSPSKTLNSQEPDIMINIAASPFSYNQAVLRKEILRKKTIEYNKPIIYVNQVGANTDLIFDGGSIYMNEKGEIINELEYFKEDFQTIETSTSKNNKEAVKTSKIELIHDALILGIRDYFEKSGFKKAILGLSGGIDSAVTLVLAARALGNENVKGVLMPSIYSSEHSIKDAIDISKNLNNEYELIEINESFESLLKLLYPSFKNLPENIAEENLQARIRGILLMAQSNKLGYILLNTSNKSELAVGYGTLYGDMCGGLSVLGDVYKTDVVELAKYINKDKEIIPINTIIKPPSAELKPNQKDSDSLPDYNILDEILFNYIEKRKGPKEIKSLGFEPEIVDKIIKLINLSEYKRNQTPPILRISDKSFGSGRRIPIVGKYF